MTTTEPRTITPCPVAWCDDHGHHLFDDQGQAAADHFAHTRTCRHEVGAPVTAWNSAGSIGHVAAAIHHGDEGELIGPYVEFDGPPLGNELRTPAEAADFLLALVNASQIAFGAEFTMSVASR